MSKLNYKGKGKHSINELETIIKQLMGELYVCKSKQKLFSSNEVIGTVLCINDEGYNFVDEGLEYDLIKESLEYIVIYDNDGDLSTYPKECFNKITNNNVSVNGLKKLS